MTYYQINSPNVIHEIIDEEAVMVNLESGSYYSLDNIGAAVWDYIGRGFSKSRIVAIIAAQYVAKQGVIEQGVNQLIEQLELEQLVVVVNPAQAGWEPPQIDAASNGQTKEKFETPILHKYTDMEDLLLLDPIHEVDETGWPNQENA